MPGLTGDYFANTLTYICEHNDEGAMGLVVNRPSDVSILELLAQLNLTADKQWLDRPVLLGGPVSRERGLCFTAPMKIHQILTRLLTRCIFLRIGGAQRYSPRPWSK